jgi:hypothetical protein
MKTIIASCIALFPTLLAAAEPIALFNGKDLGGWTIDAPARDGLADEKEVEIKDGIITMDTRKVDWWQANPPSFIVRDGLLVSLGRPIGHLITEKEFSNYKLVLEYRFSKEPGNCGVLVHTSTPRQLNQIFPQSVEVQLMHENAGDFWCIGENIEVPDMAKRRPRKEGQAYGGGAPDARRIIKHTHGAEKPVGHWNTMEIECRGNEIIVHVNGTPVNHGFNSTANTGKIALQSEGVEVEFRKVELARLPE